VFLLRQRSNKQRSNGDTPKPQDKGWSPLYSTLCRVRWGTKSAPYYKRGGGKAAQKVPLIIKGGVWSMLGYGLEEDRLFQLILK